MATNSTGLLRGRRNTSRTMITNWMFSVSPYVRKVSSYTFVLLHHATSHCRFRSLLHYVLMGSSLGLVLQTTRSRRKEKLAYIKFSHPAYYTTRFTMGVFHLRWGLPFPRGGPSNQRCQAKVKQRSHDSCEQSPCHDCPEKARS